MESAVLCENNFCLAKQSCQNSVDKGGVLVAVDYVSLLCLNKVSYCFKKSDVKAWYSLYNMEFGACFLQLLTNRADFTFDANNSVFKQGCPCGR